MSTYTLPRWCAIGIKHKGIVLHGFSDASKNASCAAVYVTTATKDGKGVQNLLVTKLRVASKNQTIPTLELVASLILAKLMAHVTDALYHFATNRIVYWVDSMTVLHWLDNKGKWSQYVRKKVKKIQEYWKENGSTWQFIKTLATLEYVGRERSQGCDWKGPNGCRMNVNDLNRHRLFKQMKVLKKRLKRNL